MNSQNENAFESKDRTPKISSVDADSKDLYDSSKLPELS